MGRGEGEGGGGRSGWSTKVDRLLCSICSGKGSGYRPHPPPPQTSPGLITACKLFENFDYNHSDNIITMKSIISLCVQTTHNSN